MDKAIPMLKFGAINARERLTSYGLNPQSSIISLHLISKWAKVTPSQRPDFVSDLDSSWLMF
jgi:hypothetical protein